MGFPVKGNVSWGNPNICAPKYQKTNNTMRIQALPLFSNSSDQVARGLPNLHMWILQVFGSEIDIDK